MILREQNFTMGLVQMGVVRKRSGGPSSSRPQLLGTREISFSDFEQLEEEQIWREMANTVGTVNTGV